MENISKTVGRVSRNLQQTTKTPAGQTISTPGSQTSKTFEELDKRVLNKLFKRLQEIFPKWREVWQSEGEVSAAKKQWSKQLVRQGVNDIEMIQAGIEQARASGWVRPPSAGQFCSWCIEAAKERAGIPGKDNAISQMMALLKRGSHNRKRTSLVPAMYTMSRMIDWYEMNTCDSDRAHKLMAKAYDEMIEHWQNGHAFYEQPTLIEHGNPSGVVTEASRNKGRETLAKLREELNGH